MKIEVSDFYVLGVMKIDENSSVWFLRIFMYGHKNRWKLKWLVFIDFMYPGSWKLMKIEVTDFYRFYVPGVMKIDENWSD